VATCGLGDFVRKRVKLSGRQVNKGGRIAEMKSKI
jgi:hypothetical protein